MAFLLSNDPLEIRDWRLEIETACSFSNLLSPISKTGPKNATDDSRAPRSETRRKVYGAKLYTAPTQAAAWGLGGGIRRSDRDYCDSADRGGAGRPRARRRDRRQRRPSGALQYR